MKILIDNGADVNAKSYEGYTALMRAAKNGQTAAVKILIQNHADINAYNSSGGSALRFAARCYHQDIVKTLLENGANPKDTANIPNPPINPLRGLVQTEYGRKFSEEIAILSLFFLVFLSLISVYRLVMKPVSLLWETLIPLSVIVLIFLYKPTQPCNPFPMMGTDAHLFYPVATLIIISSLGALIKRLSQD